MRDERDRPTGDVMSLGRRGAIVIESDLTGYPRGLIVGGTLSAVEWELVEP